MSDSDNDVGRAGELPAHDLAEPAPASDSSQTRRAMRGWVSALGASKESSSVITRVRRGLSTLFKPTPPSSSTSQNESSRTLEFQPVKEITLFRPTPQNLDIAGRLGALERKERREERSVPTEPIIELPTKPIRWPALATLLQRIRFWREKTAPAAAAGAETVIDGNPVFLYEKFRTFYNEIIRFKHRKTEFTAGFSTAMMSEAAALPTDANGAAEALSKKLIEVLELQGAQAKWMGGEIAARYPDAQFAMAALADETFTHLDWEGQSVWQDHLLEQKLFRSRAAAHDLFKRIDRLLKDAPNTPISRDLARVYLMILAAGFQGKYRAFGLTRALAEYRQRLYEYIYRGDALLLYSPDRTLIPEISTRTVVGHAVSRVSGAQRWAAILAFVVVSYAVIAHVTWNRVSADLKDVTGRIVADSTGSIR
ncbi:MAG: DotU family type IV/VI secretion system protein [Gemmatimonadaceae bacterium]